MEIAEPAEEWLTSAQAMSLARRTGTDRVMPWEQMGQAGVAARYAERSPAQMPPAAPRAAGRSTRAATASAPTAAGRAGSPSGRVGERWHRPRCSPPPGGGGPTG